MDFPKVFISIKQSGLNFFSKTFPLFTSPKGRVKKRSKDGQSRGRQISYEGKPEPKRTDLVKTKEEDEKSLVSN